MKPFIQYLFILSVIATCAIAVVVENAANGGDLAAVATVVSAAATGTTVTVGTGKWTNCATSISISAGKNMTIDAEDGAYIDCGGSGMSFNYHRICSITY